MEIKLPTKKTQGLTLLEVLLVIALLSIMAAFAIKFVRQRAVTARIDTTSVEMQHVLQAALAYNVDNNKWPDANSALPVCNPAGNANLTNFLDNYLPNGNYTSRYGDDYCWSEAGATHRLFWVALKAPGNNAQMAARIASHLPNAITTSDPKNTTVNPPACTAASCYVRAEVAQPGTNNVQGMMLIAHGICRSNAAIISGKAHCSAGQYTGGRNGVDNFTITFPACPSGLKPELMISPNLINMPSKTDNGFAFSSLEAYQQKACTQIPDANGNEACYPFVHISLCTGDHCKLYSIFDLGGSAGATYGIVCAPKADLNRVNNTDIGMNQMMI